MSRPVIIRNGASDVKNVKDKNEKLLMFGSQYHIVFDSLVIASFNVSEDAPGGIVTYHGRPFGIVGVPSSITGDDSIRILSIHNMSIKTPDDGSDSVDYRDTTDVVMYGATYCPPRWSVGANFTGIYYSQSKEHSTSLSDVYYYDGFHDHKEWIRVSDYYDRLPNWRTRTPLDSYKSKSGSISPNSLTEPDSSSNANRTNRGYSEAAMVCWRYNPVKEVLDTQGYWYLPGFYELVYEAKNATAISNALAYIKTTYNKGIGGLMKNSNLNSTGNEGYFSSAYKHNDFENYGGRVGKYHVGYDRNFTQWGSCPPDPGMVQAWCKLMKVNGKWVLDPSYHID